jgi:hypothetical protein
MFSSLSSCTPASTVTTSFTSSKNQDLLINQPVKVVGPNVYYVSSTASSYQVATSNTGATYGNPTLHLVRGTTYKFHVNNPNESFYIATSGGTAYTTGFRYVYTKTSARFFGTGVPNGAISIFTPTSAITYTTAVDPDNIWLFRNMMLSPFTATFMQEGIDYTKSSTYTGSAYTITYNFFGTLDATVVRFVHARYTLPRILHKNNWVIRTSSGVLASSAYNIIGDKLYLNTWYSQNVMFTVEPQGGMNGYVLFTPSATTPSSLTYRSRVTPGLQGSIVISNDGTLVPASTKVELKELERVSVSVTAPNAYLAYNSYEYFLDNMQNYFAVVTQNWYRPLIKIPDRIRKYHNYINYASNFTLYDIATKTEVYSSVEGLGTGEILGKIDIKYSHILLDIVNYKVNFYSSAGGLLKTVYLPDFPIQWEKFTYVQSGVEKTDLIVLAADGIVYRINDNLQVTASEKYTPAVRTQSFLDSNLPFNEDIPFKGSFTSFARRNLVASLFPVVVSFAVYSPTVVWLAGSNRIAKINLSTGTIISDNVFGALDEFLNICPFDSGGVIATTVFHRIYYIRDNGSYIDLTPTGGPFVLGVPCPAPFARGGRVVIPDCHNRRLICINSRLPTDTSFINLGDFVPSYAKLFGDTVYVTGHDNNQVIKIEITDIGLYPITENAGTRITKLDLSSKVTVVSVLNQSLLAHHYMNNRTTLNFTGTGIKKIIPVKYDYREGPSSSIGTDPRIIRILGEDTVTPIPGPYMSWWVNGTIKDTVRDSQYVGINYRASVPGPHRSYIIFGETAIDYDTKTFSSETAYDYYDDYSYGTHLMPATGLGLYYVPPQDVVGVYTLPFYINFYGNSYNSFQLGTTGILSFDLAFPVSSIIPNFTNSAADTLIVEPRKLYVDRPIDNSNVAAVTWGSLPGSVTPGVYYQSGIMGEFQYYRIKFVGTTALPNPNGFTRTTVPTPQVGTEINMEDTATVAVLDYVSNPITSPGPPYATITSTGPVVGTPSCRVSAVSTYSAAASGYWTTGGNIIYLTAPVTTPFKLYSNIKSSTDNFNFYGGYYHSDLVAGNILLGANALSRTITLQGAPPAAPVDLKWIYEVETTTVTRVTERGSVAPFFSNVLSTATSVATNQFYSAASVASSVASFNPIQPKTANVLVQVSKSVYDSLFVGQDLKSTVYAGVETITDKVVITRTYQLLVRPSAGYEGVGSIPPTTFTISVVTTNVDDGTNVDLEILPGNYRSPFGQPATVIGPDSDFLSNVVLVWPGTLRSNVTITLSSLMTIPIYNNRVDIRVSVNQDALVEPQEDFKLRLSNINPGTSDVATLPEFNFATAVGPTIGRSQNNLTMAANPKPVEYYYIQFGNAYTTSTSTIFYTDTTTISFASALPSTLTVGTTVSINAGLDTILGTYDDEQVTTTSTGIIRYKLYQIGTNETFSSTLTTVTPLTFTGKYLTLSAAQNLPGSTPMLFKAPDFHPIVEYEVAFYVGRNFQYIEYNYVGQPQHDNTLAVGLRNGLGNRQIRLPNTPIDTYSHLFGSDSGTGILLNIGPGEFSPIPLNAFIPRYPRIFRERVFDETTVRYDIYIDFKIPSTTDVRASLDYGYLKVNDGFYTGTVNIKENDILSVFVPFVDNRTVSAVILSIGNAQFAIPVAPEKDIKNKVETVQILNNQAIGQNIQSTFVVPATGTYMVPDYFKNAAGTGGAELEFERWTAIPPDPLTFHSILARGAYHELSQNDEVRVKNIFTGYRYYDTIGIIFSGVHISKLLIKTTGAPDLVNYLNYAPLEDAFSYQYKPGNLLVYGTPTVFAPGLETVANIGQINFSGTGPSTFDETFSSEQDKVPLYEARSLPLTVSSGTIGLPVNLFVSGSNVNFIVNGVRTYSNTVTVNSGAELGLEWELFSYHAPNVAIWQITTDSFDNSNVYTQVGEWPIVNRTIEDVLLVNGIPGGGRSVREVIIISGGQGYDRDLVAVTFSAPEIAGGESARGFALVSDPGAFGTGGAITGIVLTSGGSGYILPPTITITGYNSSNPNYVAAVTSAPLVDNIMPRETAIHIGQQFEKERYTLPIADLPDLETTSHQFSELRVTQEPLRSNIEYNFITQETRPLFDAYSYQFLTTAQVQTKFIADTLFTVQANYEYIKSDTILTPSQLNEFVPVQFNLPSAALSFAPVLKYTDLASPLLNSETVMRQATSTTGFSNFTSAFAATLWTGTNTYEFATITQTSLDAIKPIVQQPFTFFVGRNSSFIEAMAQVFSVKLSGDYLFISALGGTGAQGTIGKPATYVSGTVLNDTSRLFLNIFNSRNIEQYIPRPTDTGGNLKPVRTSDTVINSDPIEISWDYINLYESDPLISEYATITQMSEGRINEVYTNAGSEFVDDIYGIYLQSPEQFGTSIDGDDVTIEVMYSTLSFDTYFINVTTPKLPDYDLSLPATSSSTAMTFDFEEQYEGLAKSISEQKDDYTIVGLSITEQKINSNQFEKDIESKFYVDNPQETEQFSGVEQFTYMMFESELIYERQQNLVYDSEFRITVALETPHIHLPDFTSKFTVETVLTPSFLEQYHQELMLLPPITPEYYSPAELLPDIDPELVFQDKLYQDLEADLFVQSALYNDLDADLYFQDKLFRDLSPALDDPGNRYLDFLPELADSGMRLFEFNPLLLDAGNRYLDFLPELEQAQDILRSLEPEHVTTGLTVPREVEFLSSTSMLSNLSVDMELAQVLLQPMQFVLWKDNEQYMPDSFTYGAFKTEFQIYADQGQGGDQGQFQGSPPGTPGRGRGPILPYREFMGSALLTKTVNYGLGGFQDQASAAMVAAKYVSAGAFQVVGTAVWNYRIYFNRRVFTPRKSMIFPKVWFIRGS